MGTITAIGGHAITVKTDTGETRQVKISPAATFQRIAPGQRDLSTAESIQFSDLAIGDRALVRLDPAAPAAEPRALGIIAIRQADVALKQEREREDWQRRGTGGLVKSVDAAAGTILLTRGSGAAAKTIAVRTTSATVLKRYAPTSVRFDEALPAPLSAIRAGDQLRARGLKTADGIDAEEVITGSFLNISGSIVTLDAATATLVIRDLATKKQLTLRVGAEAEMRRLPERVAQNLAARLKENAGGKTGASDSQNGDDPQQALNSAPAIRFAELKKGEAVMLVADEGASSMTVISLLAGVEPLLVSPAASQNLLSNWSMSSGAEETAQ
jgi:hypothetical protein